MSESTLTVEGECLVAAWRTAVERLERAERELNSARCDLSNATNALGRWITPEDTEVDEVLSVWWGDKLLTSRMTRPGTYEITIRDRRRNR